MAPHKIKILNGISSNNPEYSRYITLNPPDKIKKRP
jgi:hypothetical protein